MYLTCFIKKIHYDKRESKSSSTFTRVLLPLRSKYIDDTKTDCFTLEFNINNQQCLLKHNNQWKNINQQGDFVIHSYHVHCEANKADHEIEQLPSRAYISHQSLTQECDKNDKLAFLYNTVKSTLNERGIPLEQNQYSHSLIPCVNPLPKKILSTKKEKISTSLSRFNYLLKKDSRA